MTCVAAHFPSCTVSCFQDSWKVPERASFTPITWVLLWWRLNLHTYCLIGRQLLWEGQFPTPNHTDIMISVLSKQAAASAFSGSNRASNLIFLGKPPLCGLGLVGGPRLSYVMEFFPSAIFWNVMKSWHALQITYFCTHLRISKKKKNQTLPRSFPCSLSFQVSLGAEGAAVVPSLPSLQLCPFHVCHLWKL